MSLQEKSQDITEKIQELLGFDEIESKIYLKLLKTGPLTASALAKDLNFDRASTYRSVEKLVERNIITTSLTNPKVCSALEPEDVFKIAVEKKEAEIKNIKRSQQEIIEDITSVRSCPASGMNFPTLKVIQGRKSIYSDIAQLIENCFETVFIVTNLEDISKMYFSLIPDKIMECEKKGGKVFLLVENTNQENMSFVKRINATEVRVSKIPILGRIVVQKDKQVIMSDFCKEEYSNEDLSISTNARDMVNNIDNLCRFLWALGKPPK
jgi:sugar-specific transcriptional regulator TrmB